MTNTLNTGPTEKPGVNPAACKGTSLIIEAEKKMDESWRHYYYYTYKTDKTSNSNKSCTTLFFVDGHLPDYNIFNMFNMAHSVTVLSVLSVRTFVIVYTIIMHHEGPLIVNKIFYLILGLFYQNKNINQNRKKIIRQA